MDQKAVEVIKEGDDSTIICQFNTNNVYRMHWYRQYPGEAPAFLLMVTLVNWEKEGHFSASLDKQKKESQFNITKVQMKDDAVYFCGAQDHNNTEGVKPCSTKNSVRHGGIGEGLRTQTIVKAELSRSSIPRRSEHEATQETVAGLSLSCVSGDRVVLPLEEKGRRMGDLRNRIIALLLAISTVPRLDAQIIQTPETLEVQEGSLFTLKCNYSSQYQPYFWYHQLPGEHLSLILFISSQESQNNKGFMAKYLKNGKESQLHRPTAQLQDSGNYFCAVQDTVI
ncbi:hypothetical protein Chor_009591 [Crotalus horridus]